MSNLIKFLSASGGLLLVATSYLHYTGTAMVKKGLAGTDLSGFLMDGLPTIWMVFSWHLLIIAIPLFLAAIFKPQWLLLVTVYGALVTTGDFLWVFSVTGWFAGTFLLASCVVVLVVSAWLQVKQQQMATS